MCGTKKVYFKNGRIPDRKFNKKELKIGTRIEKEHTNITGIAKQIAKTHLKESKNYYKNKLFRKERIKATKSTLKTKSFKRKNTFHRRNRK